MSIEVALKLQIRVFCIIRFSIFRILRKETFVEKLKPQENYKVAKRLSSMIEDRLCENLARNNLDNIG